jgi:hypothetical protein
LENKKEFHRGIGLGGIMKRSWMVAIVALATMIFACSAFATPELKIVSGATTIIITDGGGSDANGAAGAITFVGVVGNFSLNVATAITEPASAPPYPHLDLNDISTSSNAGGTITFYFTDTSQTATSPMFKMSIGGTLAPGSIAYSAYVDPANAKYGTTNLIGSLGPFTSASDATAFSGSLSGPGRLIPNYSLTEIITLTHIGAGTTSFDAALTPVPEPSALLLIGSGLACIGIWRIRKRN